MAQKPAPKRPVKKIPEQQAAAQKPRTREQAIRKMMADNPEKAAALLREILNGKK